MTRESPRAARVQIFCDGASRGNPGPAAVGGVILKGGQVVREISARIEPTTNNVAEYLALIHCVQAAHELGLRSLEIFMDSELVVKQVRGEYKVKKPHLQPLHRQARELLSGLDWEIAHVPRKENAHADRLANEALDRG